MNSLLFCPVNIPTRLKRFMTKKCFFFLFFFILIINIFLSSCNDNGYDLGEFCISYGILQKEDNNFTILLDEGPVLQPVTPVLENDFFQDNDRILVDFTLLQHADSTAPYDYYAKINDIYKILTKDIITYSAGLTDSLGHDPVHINDLWIINGYFTFDFSFTGGQSGAKHLITLAKHPEKTADNRILLDFRHNAFGDHSPYQYRGLIAFPVGGISETLSDSIPLQIQYEGNDQTEFINITWYINPALQNRKEEKLYRNIPQHSDRIFQ